MVWLKLSTKDPRKQRPALSLYHLLHPLLPVWHYSVEADTNTSAQRDYVPQVCFAYESLHHLVVVGETKVHPHT